MVGWWFLLMLRHLILRYPRIQPLTSEFTNVHGGGFCVCSLPAVDPWGRRFPTFLGDGNSLLHRRSDLEAGMMYSKNLFNPKNLVEIGWIRRLEFGKALDDWNCLCFFLVRFIQRFWLLFIYSVLSVGLKNNTGWCFFQLFFMFTPNLGEDEPLLTCAYFV